MRSVITTILCSLLSLTASAQTPADSVPASRADAAATSAIDAAPLRKPLRHDLQITLDPLNHSIAVVDSLSLPDSYRGQQLRFRLNSNLRITSSSLPVTTLNTASSGQLVATTVAQEAAATEYQVSIPARRNRPLVLEYEGIINDLAEQDSPEYAQSFAQTSGIISAQGVFLSRASLWVPLFDEGLLSFEMEVDFADSASSWSVVSQGMQPQSRPAAAAAPRAPRLRAHSPLRGAQAPTIEQVQDMVETALYECERFYPAFQFVIWGGRSAKDAMAAALLETVGEA